MVATQTFLYIFHFHPWGDDAWLETIKASKGYLITESELRLNSFSVAVKCTPGYAGISSRYNFPRFPFFFYVGHEDLINFIGFYGEKFEGVMSL